MIKIEGVTEDTKFELLVGVYLYDDDGYISATFYNGSIDDMKDSEALCIYALINGKLELIWEREKKWMKIKFMSTLIN